MDAQKLKDQQENEANERQQNPPNDLVPSIFKLLTEETPKDSDCINKLLEYLSVDDLHSLMQTCTRLEQSVVHFYHLRMSEMIISNDSKYVGFRKCAKYLKVFDRLTKAEWDQFKSVKQIYLIYSNLRYIPVEFFKKITHASLYNGLINMNYKKHKRYVDALAAHIKHLEIVDPDDDWLLQKYSKLEHFLWSETEKCSSMKDFFQKNPSIRSFAARASFCLANATALKKAKFKKLYIFGSTGKDVCDLLNNLHADGVYKQLYITTDAYQENIDRLNKMKFLYGLEMFDVIEEIDLSALINLRALTFKTPSKNIGNILNKASLAQSLEFLEEVRFWNAYTNDILPFMYCSIRLKKVIVDNPLLGNDEAIDLIAINSEREKLFIKASNVSKVTVYVCESNYVATKWKNTETNYKLIEIQRRTSWTQFWHSF